MSKEKLKYTQEHEWISIDGNIVTVGITDHAAEELGEVVYVELPEKDTEYSKEDEVGTIESVKTVSSLYSPLTGKITEVNDELDGEPTAINDAPFGNGWIFKLELSDTAEVEELLSLEDYEDFLASL
jgi:glycine cleavage system H protein